ncbi:RDD family protein [Nocardioides limicola]|uniref:RDD family protein n=1 Tax=Nocardioides limicola TaxID=2803368 RepID=UPI00193BCDB2|nr:RDD family protein [Nocardioides sp. DJM-14]
MSDPNTPNEQPPSDQPGSYPPPPPNQPGSYPPPPQPGYGQAPQPGYGQAAQQPYGQMPPAGVPNPYAHWGKRVVSYLIDSLIVSAVMLPFMVIYGIFLGLSVPSDPYAPATEVNGPMFAISMIFLFLGIVAGLAVFVWNTCLKGGRTGWSIGKGVMGIRLLSAQTGQPIGAGMAFVRHLAHILDSLPCNLGYLWPLWDEKRQTFADKILNTVVIEQPKP